MESFWLVLWLWIGQRFEETRMLTFDRSECFALKTLITADRGADKAKAECVGPVAVPPVLTFPPCAYLDGPCDRPLPAGRRRV